MQCHFQQGTVLDNSTGDEEEEGGEAHHAEVSSHGFLDFLLSLKIHSSHRFTQLFTAWLNLWLFSLNVDVQCYGAALHEYLQFFVSLKEKKEDEGQICATQRICHLCRKGIALLSYCFISHFTALNIMHVCHCKTLFSPEWWRTEGGTWTHT